jgi:drug/metabolite transporter (DMT)-like permease
LPRLSKHDLNLLFVSLIWGANYSVSKQALGYISPVTFSALRFLISTVLLWLVVRTLKDRTPVPRATVRKLMGWGIVGHTLNQLAFLSGLKLTTATNSALIFGNLPVVVAVLGMLSGAERPRPRVWVGIGLGVLGVVMIVGAKGMDFGGDTLLGDGLNLLGLFFWALFTVGVRQAALGSASVKVALCTHLGGTPGLVVAATPGLVSLDLGSLHPWVWIALLYSSIFSSVIASVLWTRSLKALGGSRTALYNCVTPLFAVMAAWLVLGERPVPLQGVGAILVIVGVLVSNTPPQAEEP